MSHRRIVITGMGWVTGLGLGLDKVWDALLAGTSGISPIKRFDVTEYDVRFGGEVTDWDGKPHLDHRDTKRMDRFCQFAMSASIDAVANSGLDFSKEDPDRCGVIIGSGVGGMDELERGCTQLIQKGPKRVSPFVIPKMMVNAASGNVSMHFGLKGPNSSAVTACASAGHAITDAFKVIRDDEADIVVTGGSEAGLTPLGLASFMTMKALSRRNEEPQKASRPFDRDRDGFVLSEGAGILIIEELEHARRRGATLYAEIVGYGMTADAGHITHPDENGTGAQKAMRRAVQMGGLNLDQIGYVNAHGTSTPLGDQAENTAIKQIFGAHAYKLAVSSTKSMTGHLLGASGGVEAIIAAKVIQTGKLPPTINLDNPGEGFDLNYVPHQAQEKSVQYAISNSFGFGGHNSCLAFARI